MANGCIYSHNGNDNLANYKFSQKFCQDVLCNKNLALTQKKTKNNF